MTTTSPTAPALLLLLGLALSACAQEAATVRQPAAPAAVPPQPTPLAQQPPAPTAGVPQDEPARAQTGDEQVPNVEAGVAHPKTIMTGGTAGTYIRIGTDMAALAGNFGLDLAVQPSAGSIENVEALLDRPHTPLGIVQSDVLDFIGSFSEDPELRRMAGKMRMVFPLYNEEVHVLARPGINRLADLQGKRVAVGQENSGTYLTATLLLAAAGVQLGEEVQIGTDEALQALRQAEVDAMFYVAGQPARIFAEDVTAADNLHLVPITEPAVRDLYPGAAIEAEAYPWLEEDVPTVAVRAVLMAYDFSKANAYQREACEAVAKVARIVHDNIAWLRQPGHGHPKWQQVNLDADLVNWERSRCAEEGLAAAEAYVLAPEEADVRASEEADVAAPEEQEANCEAEANPRRRMLCQVRQRIAQRQPDLDTGAAEQPDAPATEAAAAAAATTPEGAPYVAKSAVSLRAAPRNASDVLTVVEEGDVVRAVDRDRGWLRVAYTDRLARTFTGWIYQRHLEPAGDRARPSSASRPR